MQQSSTGIVARSTRLIHFLLFMIVVVIVKAQGQSTTSGSCQSVGCVSCQSNSGSSSWSRSTLCASCASTADQKFQLRGGRCMCQPGHGLVRQAAPANNGYYGCIRTRQPAYTGRRLLQISDPAVGPSPAADPTPLDSAVVATVAAAAPEDQQQQQQQQDQAAADVAEQNVTSSNPVESSDTTQVGAAADISSSSSIEEARRRVAALEEEAAAEYKAAVAKAAVEKEAKVAAQADKRLAALNTVQQQHKNAVAKAKAAVAAAQAASKEAQAAVNAAAEAAAAAGKASSNGTVRATSIRSASAAAKAADRTVNRSVSVAEKIEEAVAVAQARLAERRSKRKATLQQKFNAQLANVTQAISTRQPASLARQQAAAARAAAAAAAAARAAASAPPYVKTSKARRGAVIRTGNKQQGAGASSSSSSSSSSTKGTAVTNAAGSSGSSSSRSSAAAVRAKQRRARRLKDPHPVAVDNGPRFTAISNALKAAGIASGLWGGSSSSGSSSSSPTVAKRVNPSKPSSSRGSSKGSASSPGAVRGTTTFGGHDRYIDRYNNAPAPNNGGSNVPCNACEIWVWVPCAPCPPGTVSTGGDPIMTQCTPCPWGQYANDDQTACVYPPPLPDGKLFPDFPYDVITGNNSNRSPPPPPPSPPPPSGKNLTARDVQVFTLAPQPVWVPFRVQGGVGPYVITVIEGSGPKKGSLGNIDQRNQQVKYTPDRGYCSITGAGDKFRYQVRDALGKTAVATASVVVDCPDAVFTEDQFVFTEVETPVDIFTPVGGGVPPYKVKIIRKPEGGVVTNILVTDVDVTFTYTPNSNYCSQDGFGDSFDFEVSEVYGSSAVGYIDVTVNCPPLPVAAPELLFNMTPQTNLSIDLQIVGAQPFTFEVLSPPLNGNLTNITSEGTTIYSPDYYYCSLFDFFDGFFYTVYDKFGQFADGAVTINVVCPDPPVVEEEQSFETPAQTPSEQQLNVTSTAELFYDITLWPSFGVVDGVDEKGISIYIPDFDFCSQQDQLDNWGFDVQDIFGQMAFGLVFVKVVCPPAPDPTDQVMRMTARFGMVVNLNLSIPIGTPPFYTEVTLDPMNGYVTPIIVDENNPTKAETTYTPYDGFCQFEDVPEIFNWAVYDPFGQFGEAGVTMFIMCPPAPTAREQSLFVPRPGVPTAIVYQVTGSPPLDWLIYGPPMSGTVTQPVLNSTTYTSIYTPNFDYCSINGDPDMMFYMVSDAFGSTADSTITITVQCPPEPTAGDVDVTMSPSMPELRITPAAGPADSQLIISVSDAPQSGNVTYNAADKVFVYVPRGGACRTATSDAFVYAVDDIYGQQTAFAAVTIDCRG